MAKLSTQTMVVNKIINIKVLNQNTTKTLTTKQEQEAQSLTFLSTWPKSSKKMLLQDIIQYSRTTRASSRMSLIQFRHTILRASLKMWMIITDSTLRALTNNHSKIMVIKIHINKIKSLINNMIIKMDSTMIKTNSIMIKTKRVTNNMRVKIITNNMMANNNKNIMISITNKLQELSLI